MMKKRLAWILILIFLSFYVRADAKSENQWREMKGDHFIIYHDAENSKQANQILRSAEGYYREIASQLGYSRRDKFWLWENRCKIYVYGSKEKFHETTMQPVWSSGFAVPEQRTIMSYVGAQHFLDSVLPHELAHLIFRDFVGVGNREIPLWMDEGLAMSQEQSRREWFNQLVKKMISMQKWIHMQEIGAIRSLKGSSTEQAAIFYAQAQSMVRTLLSAGNPDKFVQLCRDLRDAKSLDEAFKSNYPKDFGSAEEFEKSWVRSNE